MRRVIFPLLILIAAALVSIVAAQPPLPLPSGLQITGRALGTSVSGIVRPGLDDPVSFAEAMNGNRSTAAPRLIVGLPEAPDGGEAQILAWDTTTWTPVQHIVLPVANAGARFGASVAIYGEEGADAVAVVGAPNYNDGGPELGAAFVYRHNTLTGWQLETALYPPDNSAIHHFGTAVEVVGSGDAATIFVSSINVDDASLTNVGVVYDYRWNSLSSDYELHKTLSSGTTNNEEYMGVSLSADLHGSEILLAVGANRGDNSGQIYVFKYSVGEWSTNEVLTSPTPVAGGRFSTDLDLDWVNDTALLVVGEPGGTAGATPNAGTAHVFTYDNVLDTWSTPATLTAYAPDDGAAFGESVALSGLGVEPVILVGEPGFDIVYPDLSVVPDGGYVHVFRDVGFWYAQDGFYSPNDYYHTGSSVEAFGSLQDGWIFAGAPTAFHPTPSLGLPGPGGLYYYQLISDNPPPVTDYPWLQNGSFETAGTKPFLAANWRLIGRQTGDGRVCGTVAGSGGTPGDKAYDGLCAVKFKGNDGVKSRLLYRISKTALEALIGQPVSTDDSLRLTLRYKIAPSSKPLVRLFG